MSVNSINDLPNELLVQIFSWYIKSVGHRRFCRNIPVVCKRWKDLHSNPALWRDLNSTLPLFTLDELNKLGERGFLSSIRNLILNYQYPFEENQFVNLMFHCRKLKRLDVTGTYRLTKLSMEVLQEQCPDIESLELRSSNKDLGDVLCPFLSVRGQNLKRLELSHSLSSNEKHLLPAIAGHCHALEQLTWTCNASSYIQFPINEIVIGCPKIRKLKIFGCNLVSSPVEFGDHNGFEDIVSFEAACTDFKGLDLYSLLKCSKELEYLEVCNCDNMILSSVSMIPSDKVKVFIMKWIDREFPMTLMKEAVGKWKHTLTTVYLPGVIGVVDNVLEFYLTGNPNPKLNDLDLKQSIVSETVLRKMMSECGNLQQILIRKPCKMNLRMNPLVVGGCCWDWCFICSATCFVKRFYSAE